MSANQAQPSNVHPALNIHEETFPWKHIMGFVLSLVMTAATLWLAFGHHMSGKPLVFTIVLLAVLQIVVQLFLFMHVTESDGTRAHVWTISLGFFFTFVVVAGSIWIMSFSSQVS